MKLILEDFLHVVLLMLIILFFTACGRTGEHKMFRSSSAPWLVKGAVVLPNRMEQTPVLWTDGSLLDVVSHRGFSAAVGSIEIYRNDVLLTTLPSDVGFISAIVENGSLYIFGTTDCGQPGNELRVLSTSDLQNFSAWQTVLTAPADTTYYNSSVAPSPNGFVLALEARSAGGTFQPQFWESSDLRTWSRRLSSLRPGVYTACPTVRWSAGYYYVFYLSTEDAYFATYVSRSRDLLLWEHSAQAVVSPDASAGEGENASDLDLVELGGVTHVRYAVGYQTVFSGSYVHVREAQYAGSLSQFLQEFF